MENPRIVTVHSVGSLRTAMVHLSLMVHLSFQVFKFIYLCRLAEMGLATQAFHYCEVIAKNILAQPGAYSPVLITQLIQVGSSHTFLLALCQLWKDTGFILLGLGMGL